MTRLASFSAGFMLIGVFIMMPGCKRERTCTCAVSSEHTTVTTPRNGAPATTTITSSTGETGLTSSRIGSSDAKNRMNCRDRKVTTSTTYTTNIQVGQPPSFADADVTQTTVSDYSCNLD
jgi:hypothetical protein